MFKEVENGSCIDVPDNAFGFVYKCQLPPVGYGVNVANGKLQQTDILKSSEVEERQMWVRPHLPADYHSRRKKEKENQKINSSHIDPYLEDIRKREWKRRLCGIWFWNYNPKEKKSELIYITGLHYLYITYWKFQGKHMDFRIPDRDLFYVIAYINEDENCLGLNEITKRKNGKTARLGCWLYERTSRMNNHHGGIQSKADDDAQEVFMKAVRDPWKTLPDFFRPVYDTMKGDSPSDELRFFATSRRGSKTELEDEDAEEALNSFIDFKSSTEAAYDGPELHSYASDESGKTKKPVSIKERQNVVRYCTEIDGKMMGKHYFTTTVEPEKGEEENYEFQELTANSNPLERDDNGRTGTGLYTYFLPAFKGMFFDEYGYPREEDAKIFLLNTRKSLQDKGDTRGLSSFKRKNPLNLKEAFSADGAFALYNPELLNQQLDEISWRNDLTEKGNFVWKDGYKFERPIEKEDGTTEWVLNEVEWVADANGRFEKVKGWNPKDANKVFKLRGKFSPNNNFAIRIGCDPFKYDKTKDKRRSNCAAYAYQIKDDLFPNDIYNDTFVLRYAHRADSTRLSNEDVLMMAWYCGCQVLFERNINHWKKDFYEWNCEGFLMWLPGEVEPGISTDGAGNVVQMICNYTESYINEHIKKVYFKTLIRKNEGWLGFKVEDTQSFDEPMGAGFTLIAVKGKKYQRKQESKKDIESVMPYRKAV